MINLARKQFAFAVALPLALSSCQTMPENTVEVKVPIPVYTPCPITPVPKPSMCVPKNDTRQEWLRCELVNHIALKQYTRELEAQLAICAE
jgi:hypothetical protein